MKITIKRGIFGNMVYICSDCGLECDIEDLKKAISESSNGRTADFDSANGGSIPSSETKLESE